MAKCDRGREALNGVGSEWRLPVLARAEMGWKGLRWVVTCVRWPLASTVF